MAGVQHLASRLAGHILRTGGSNAEAAEAIGVSVPTISRWVNGKTRISQRHLLALAGYLGVDEETVTLWASEDIATDVVARPATVSPVSTAEADELRQELAELRRALAELQREVRRTPPE